MRSPEENYTEDGTIEVKIMLMGGELRIFTLPEDSTVADALAAAGFSPESTVKCQGVAVTPDHILDDGDRLTVTNKVKGGLPCFA